MDNTLKIFGLVINANDLKDEKTFKEIISDITNFEKYCMKTINENDRLESYKIIVPNTSLHFVYENGSLKTFVEIKTEDTTIIARSVNSNLFLKIWNTENLEFCFNRMKNYQKLENVKLYSKDFNGKENDER